MRKHCNIILIISFLIITNPLLGRTIWKDKNLYSSSDILKVGDIIQVNVIDVSSLSFALTLGSESDSSVTSNPDITITGFLPKISSNKKSANRDNTQVSGQGQINISIAARLTARDGNGYRISGSRVYSFNGVNNTFSVNGTIDPVMVQGRVIESNNVLNFRLTIRGSKQGAINIKRDQLKKDEAANVTLTEEEKQKIITDYLNKMINEMTR